MAIAIRQAYFEANVIAETVRMSFRDVAEKFEITREAAPTHPSQCEAEWIQSEMDAGWVYLVAEEEGAVIGLRLSDLQCYLSIAVALSLNSSTTLFWHMRAKMELRKYAYRLFRSTVH